MKHVLYGGKSLLMDDEAADLLLEYAAALAGDRTGDTVKVTAVSPDGNTVSVTFLLNGSTELIAETTHSAMDAPRDDEAVAYMRERLSAIRTPPPAQPEVTDPSLPQYPGEL